MSKGRQLAAQHKQETRARKAIETYNRLCNVASIENWQDHTVEMVRRCEDCRRPVLPADEAQAAWNAIQGDDVVRHTACPDRSLKRLWATVRAYAGQAWEMAW